MESAMADWGAPPENPAIAVNATEELHACNSLGEFKDKFSQLIEREANAMIPQLFTIQLALGPMATFDIEIPTPSSVDATTNSETTGKRTSPPKKRRRGQGARVQEARVQDTTSQTMSVMELVNNQPLVKPIPILRSAVKTVMAIVNQIDGFGWQNHNTWHSEDGWRLEYVCNDSYQNKSRAANKVRKGEDADDKKEEDPNTKKENRQALPTFDCGGRVYCIFSVKQASIVVKYSHNLVHRSVASRKQQQFPSAPDKKSSRGKNSPVIASTEMDDRHQPTADDRHQPAARQAYEPRSSPNLLQASVHGHGHGYPPLTKNPLGISNWASGAGGSSTQSSSPYNSPHSNPLRSPDAMPMVTVLQDRSGSVDFSIKRSKALSLLAARGIDARTLSEYQLQIFQDQDAISQQTSLRLFEEYGPSQLMVVAHDIPGGRITLGADSLPPLLQSAPFNHLRNDIPRVPSFGSGHAQDARRPSSSQSLHQESYRQEMMSNTSRRSSLASYTEVGSSEDHSQAPASSIWQGATKSNGNSARNDFDLSSGDKIYRSKNSQHSLPKEPKVIQWSPPSPKQQRVSESGRLQDLTKNGTPKQPGVYEFDSEEKAANTTTKTPTARSSGIAKGKWARKPSESPQSMESLQNVDQRKSRSKTGCTTCGKRRMKCDEGHPSCSNCSRAGKDCVYPSTPSVSSSPAQATWNAASSPAPFGEYQQSISIADDDMWLQGLIEASMAVEGGGN